MSLGQPCSGLFEAEGSVIWPCEPGRRHVGICRERGCSVGRRSWRPRCRCILRSENRSVMMISLIRLLISPQSECSGFSQQLRSLGIEVLWAWAQARRAQKYVGVAARFFLIFGLELDLIKPISVQRVSERHVLSRAKNHSLIRYHLLWFDKKCGGTWFITPYRSGFWLDWFGTFQTCPRCQFSSQSSKESSLGASSRHR